MNFSQALNIKAYFKRSIISLPHNTAMTAL